MIWPFAGDFHLHRAPRGLALPQGLFLPVATASSFFTNGLALYMCHGASSQAEFDWPGSSFAVVSRWPACGYLPHGQVESATRRGAQSWHKRGHAWGPGWNRFSSRWAWRAVRNISGPCIKSPWTVCGAHPFPVGARTLGHRGGGAGSLVCSFLPFLCSPVMD